MRARTSLLVLSCTIGASAYQEAHEITGKNWDKVQDGTWLLKFYAPWCAHCKKMAPIFEEVAEHFHRPVSYTHLTLPTKA